MQKTPESKVTAPLPLLSSDPPFCSSSFSFSLPMPVASVAGSGQQVHAREQQKEHHKGERRRHTTRERELFSTGESHVTSSVTSRTRFILSSRESFSDTPASLGAPPDPADPSPAPAYPTTRRVLRVTSPALTLLTPVPQPVFPPRRMLFPSCSLPCASSFFFYSTLRRYIASNMRINHAQTLLRSGRSLARR